MIRKVYKVDPMLYPKCGGTMKAIAFIMGYPGRYRGLRAGIATI